MKRSRARTALTFVLPIALTLLPALARASSGGEGGLTMEQILWEMGIKVLDVAIIAFFGFKFLSKPLTRLMEGRSEAVRRALDEASAARRAAEERLQAQERRSAGLEAEIEQLRQQACQDIDREQKILFEEAKLSAERVRQHARETIQQEVAKARGELHREAALLAVQIATAQVKAQITAEDQQRILDEYAASLESGR